MQIFKFTEICADFYNFFCIVQRHVRRSAQNCGPQNSTDLPLKKFPDVFKEFIQINIGMFIFILNKKEIILKKIIQIGWQIEATTTTKEKELLIKKYGNYYYFIIKLLL